MVLPVGKYVFPFPTIIPPNAPTSLNGAWGQMHHEPDKLGQQYNEPEYAIKEKAADIAVAGRGILQTKCVATAAALYRRRLGSAYKDRLAKK
uniref:Uncharacterized protein n=1 Tax=Glossina austeni TaxID=7395 RepID=A0A1A9US53_GLOAU